MFILSNYIEYLDNSMRQSYFSNPNCKYKKQDFIDSLTNFSAKSHGTKLGARPGDQIKRLFTTLAIGKPQNVSYTHWFLFNYGYKHCYKCSKVLHIVNFSSNKTTWNTLSSICKDCDNKRSREYKEQNKDQTRAAYALWYKNNKHIRAAASAKRRAAIKLAIPKWLTEEHLEEIKELYKVASTKNLEVDHIVPLQGHSVCGLHVPWNLQLISEEDNRRKSNKYNDW